MSTHGATSAKKDSETTAAHELGSAKSATRAGAEASRIAPNATAVTIPAPRKTADWPMSGATSVHAPSAPPTSTPAAMVATFTASIASARTRLATSLAPRTRERTGTSANVMSPVRCDHSDVTSRTPATGRRTAAGCSAMARKAANV